MSQDEKMSEGSETTPDAGDGAVDTGRRIDPNKLSFRGTRLRGGEGGAPRRGQNQQGAESVAPEAERAPAESGESGPPSSGKGVRVLEKDDLYQKRGGRRGDDRSGGGRGDRRERGGGGGGGPSRDVLPPRPPRPESKDEGSFADMFAASEKSAKKQRRVEVGDKIEVECCHIGDDSAFFAIDGKAEAVMPLGELVDGDGNVQISVGEKITAFVVSTRNGIELSKKIGRDRADPALLEEARASGIPVDGKVTGVNKGGVEVELMGTRGFCPMGQLDAGFLPDASALVGQTLSFLIKEVKENGKNIVLSRRALMEREKKEQAQKTLASIQVGQIVTGTVVRVQPFGAFVDIGGIDGLVPVSELSWARVEDPTSVVSPGDQLKLEILRIEPDEKRKGELRISLSKKRAMPDPFATRRDELPVGANVSGRVVRLERFGAFIELLEKGSGIEGLAHISTLSDKRVHHPQDVVKVGAEVTVRILDVDAAEKRIALSLKDADLPEGKTRDDVAREQVRGVARGKRVSGVVERLERYGAFLKLDDGPTALLPISESGIERGDDMSKSFAIGTKHEVLVIDVDERNRVKVSKIARERDEERSVVEEFQKKSGGTAGFGTLGDLLKAKLGK